MPPPVSSAVILTKAVGGNEVSFHFVFFKQAFKQVFICDELKWQSTHRNVMLLWFVKNSGIKAWVLYWCQTRKIVI